MICAASTQRIGGESWGSGGISGDLVFQERRKDGGKW